ncbi:aspartyl-tRNA(Asn)/glutamyl-tRNA(Gln) amidotransferase subunit A [Roseovarius azorensis]|uniref:Aspartyl-tRNA(Asn)/glutamyl-tRNA(Gln) amidotransferase subunit A n=1 Tax=Roseovarius azorensis TaxID=1287727 RepID=A0A1H7S3N9_9RHOB|nr:amidase [Roseovarius azorensis]SEL67212.1 aspartyl-tRNA(Asn)/glutamyl-tRNA(Gln) amidotransferase subunit A [Roseovarius azorensis]
MNRPELTFATEDPLCRLNAHEALDLFRSGSLSPVELLSAQIARANEVEPVINAFTETFFDTAMEAARLAEQRYLARVDDLRPLEGLGVTIKDVLDQKGAHTTYGSIVYRDNLATRDHPVVTRIRNAGGIIHARTTTSELAFGWITATRLWGVTRNPWNPDLTPGGSSGGAAASLAAGTSTLAIGADSAGSIRVPAALCGVVGYKPPTGRIPDPVEGQDPYNVIGPLARNVRDCALLQNVISGMHPSDIGSLSERVELPLVNPGVAGLRLAFSTGLGKTAPTSSILAVIQATIKQMRSVGIVVEEPDIDWPSNVIDDAKAYAIGLVATKLGNMLDKHGMDVCDYITWIGDTARNCDVSVFSRAIETKSQLYSKLSDVIYKFDALICPVVLTNRVGAEQRPWTRMTINGVELDSDYDWVATPHFNMLGQLPALSVPIGLDDNGLPVGLQVVSRPFDDRRAFRVALAIESVVQSAM